MQNMFSFSETLTCETSIGITYLEAAATYLKTHCSSKIFGTETPLVLELRALFLRAPSSAATNLIGN